MSEMQVLVVADQAADRQRLAEAIGRAGHAAHAAQGVVEALQRLAEAPFDAIFCAAHLGDGDAATLLREARARGSSAAMVVIACAAPDGAAAQSEALSAGAWDVLEPPLRDADVAHRLGQIEMLRTLRREARALRSVVMGGMQPAFQFVSPAMQAVEKVVARIGPGDGPVLIVGESGTGKGVTARRLHELSARRDAPFVAVNCAAIPEALVESELLGGTQGAFASAERPRRGLFAQAEHGTLFLEAIERLPLALQSRLLQWLEAKERPGAAPDARLPADVRLVGASHRDLQLLVLQGRFCAGLLHRMAANRIAMPPLRERRVDIPALVQHLLVQRVAPSGAGATLAIDRDAMEMLVDYHWPGNVRQLVNVLHRAAILADGECIRPADLPPEVTRVMDGTDPGELTLRERVRRFELSLILRAIEECGGDRRAAAARLGIGLSSLYRKLEEFQGEVPTGH